MHPPDAPHATIAALRDARLHYTSDAQTGIERRRRGRDFDFYLRGRKIINPAELRRIRALVIPPAWKDVWISPDPQGHIQAIGRDDRGRKQYRYHRLWRETRDETKYHRMIAFGRALPKIRARVRRDIRRVGLGRDKVLAAVVRLLELSSIRIGNEEYARHNKSYGLTTLRDHHARTRGSMIHLRFRGKSGKNQAIDIEHPVLARIVRKCRDLPGQNLFQYLDDDEAVRDVTSDDVNEYLRQITRQDFTAKDFRTWTGTVLAALALREFGEIDSQAIAKKNIVAAIEQVARRLGNTPSVCRKCYVHPVVLESYLDGTLVKVLQKDAEREIRTSIRQLRPEEAAVVALLQRRLREGPDAATKKQLKASLRRFRKARPPRKGSAKSPARRG